MFINEPSVDTGMAPLAKNKKLEKIHGADRRYGPRHAV
jgi:hypothetical protein